MKKILYGITALGLLASMSLVFAQEFVLNNSVGIKGLSVQLTTDGIVDFGELVAGGGIHQCSLETDEIILNASVGYDIQIAQKTEDLTGSSGTLTLSATATEPNTFKMPLGRGKIDDPACGYLLSPIELSKEYRISDTNIASNESVSYSYGIWLSDVINNLGNYTSKTYILATSI